MRFMFAIAVVSAIVFSGTTARAAGPDQSKPDQTATKDAEQKGDPIHLGKINLWSHFHGKPDQVKSEKSDPAKDEKPDQVKGDGPDQVKLHHFRPDQVKGDWGLHGSLKHGKVPAHAQVSK